MVDVIRAGGGIRSDDEALEFVSASLRADPGISAVVSDIGDRHVAKGAFGLLMPARLRDDGTDVLIKVNATEHERRWLGAIGDVDPLAAPAVYASGGSFSDVKLGWTVVERLPYQPPGFGGPEWYHSAARDRRERDLPTPGDADVRLLSELFCAWLSVMWRVLFKDIAPERRDSAARYVDRALVRA